MSRIGIATRNACFAIISAIEEDLRAVLRAHAAGQGNTALFPQDVRENAARRYKSDLQESEIESEVDLLEYIDFADLAKMLHRHKSVLDPIPETECRRLAGELERNTAARNRVCHSRPLEPEDLPQLRGLAGGLASSSDDSVWAQVRLCLSLLHSDPSFPHTLAIPTFWNAGRSGLENNLPLADFDETGFLGRRDDRKKLLELLRSHHPVLTVVGEGGVGKTALALRCLYDLVDEGESSGFDAVIWVSAKTSILTAAGAESIASAIADTLGVLAQIGEVLGATSPASAEHAIAGILEYLSSFRILLAIDNLETLSEGSLRDLLQSIPPGSKVLLTSRVGLGEIELRFPLDPLDGRTAQSLLRRFASVTNVKALASAKNVPQICESLFHNPLLIKWFVSSVALGADPNALFDRGSEDYQAAIRFCFENLFQRLSSDEIEVLHLLQSAKRPVSRAELTFLTADLKRSDLEAAVSTLSNSSMVRRSSKRNVAGIEYSLTEVASEYLSLYAPPPSDLFGRVRSALKQLSGLAQEQSVKQATYKYDPFALHASTKDELISAVYLRRAIDASKREILEEARRSIAEAKALTPSYSEVYRIAGVVESAAGDSYRASEEFERAVEVDPESTIARFSYSRFLSRYLEDFEAALTQVEIAIVVDPEDTTLLGHKALMLNRVGRCSEAAAIYENLLDRLENTPARWVLPTIDQAADCYRRWSEQDLVNDDSAAHRQHVDRGLQILEAAFGRQEYDGQMKRRYIRLMNEGFIEASRAVENERASELAAKLAAACKYLDVIVLPFRGASECIAAFPDQPQIVDILRPFAESPRSERPIANLSTQESGSTRGVIRKMVPGLPFGFIRDSEGRDWFFHKNHLADAAEWSSVAEGQAASFRVGANARGPCAVDVRVL